jgi:hypothetical protein
MIPFQMKNCLGILRVIYLDTCVDITNYLSISKVHSLWSKRRKDLCFKFKLKGQKALSASRMWIPLTWQIPYILTTWVNFIGSSIGLVHSVSLHQGTWSPSNFIFSIVVSFFDYLYTTMCYTWLVFGWSITYFFQDMFLHTSLGVWYAPHLLIQVFIYFWSYFSVLYTHWRQCVVQVWRYGRTKHYPKILAMLFLSMQLILNSNLRFIGELNHVYPMCVITFFFLFFFCFIIKLLKKYILRWFGKMTMWH